MLKPGSSYSRINAKYYAGCPTLTSEVPLIAEIRQVALASLSSTRTYQFHLQVMTLWCPTWTLARNCHGIDVKSACLIYTDRRLKSKMSGVYAVWP